MYRIGPLRARAVRRGLNFGLFRLLRFAVPRLLALPADYRRDDRRTTARPAVSYSNERRHLVLKRPAK